jgi:hypothetical protein
MPSYDEQLFSPPAPVAAVTLRHPESGATLANVPLLIDSGADVTLLPQSAVEVLGVEASPGEGYELMGFDGSKSVAQVVRLDLIFLRKTFKGRFLLTGQDCGILGRDVLNHVAIILDGPNLVWTER